MTDAPSIVVVGCGAIGLPLAVALASRGQDVEGFDINAEHVARLQAGNLEIAERALQDALQLECARGGLRFVAGLRRSSRRRVYILAVPTPVDERKRCIGKFIEAAFDGVAKCASPGDLLIVRSTVPVGTSRKLATAAAQRGLQIEVAACPDRSLSGRAFAEQFSVPTIVGGVTPEASRRAIELFGVLGEVHDIGSSEAAEALKLFANVQRDIQFAIANQFALLCEEFDLDFGRIAEIGSRSYPRFYSTRPGPVAGPCLSKDAYLLAASMANGEGVELALAARSVNASLLHYAIEVSRTHLRQRAVEAPIAAVLGLAFKGEPPTEDCRESFGLCFVNLLKHELPHVGIRTWNPPLASTSQTESMRSAVAGADLVILTNDHAQLRGLDLRDLASCMRRQGLILDMCGSRGEIGTLPNGVCFHAFGSGSLSPGGDGAERSSTEVPPVTMNSRERAISRNRRR